MGLDWSVGSRSPFPLLPRFFLASAPFAWLLWSVDAVPRVRIFGLIEAGDRLTALLHARPSLWQSFLHSLCMTFAVAYGTVIFPHTATRGEAPRASGYLPSTWKSRVCSIRQSATLLYCVLSRLNQNSVDGCHLSTQRECCRHRT